MCERTPYVESAKEIINQEQHDIPKIYGKPLLRRASDPGTVDEHQEISIEVAHNKQKRKRKSKLNNIKIVSKSLVITARSWKLVCRKESYIKFDSIRKDL